MLAETLAGLDGYGWLQVLVKAAGYAAALLAAGGVAVLAALPVEGRVATRLRWSTAAAALAAAALAAVRIPVRAGFLAGGSVDGAVDPMLVGLVMDSPLGTAAAWRIVGAALIVLVVLPHRAARAAAWLGAAMVCASFAMRGHALESPRGALAALVTVHVAGLAFWIAALGPLAHAARIAPAREAARLAGRFGVQAAWVVAGLVVAGVTTLWLLGGLAPAALLTAYGQGFALKLALVAGLLGLAALNRQRLVPALARGDPGAAMALRRSIATETVVIAAILCVTAVVTITSPPPG